jgi:ubiquinone/menaquinone biosynthesis C-methylase UbiE
MKKIKSEFGFNSEARAVTEYRQLNQDFMSINYSLIADEVSSKFDFSHDNILDIGTGLGSLAFEFALRFPESQIYGVDISREMLMEAIKLKKERGIDNVFFELCNAEDMDFSDNFFGLIVSFGVLHHLYDLKKVFREITRTLKKGGIAYIYDLSRDASINTVNEIAKAMNENQQKAFLESVKEAVDLSYLNRILAGLSVSKYIVSTPRYSRATIIKNKTALRASGFLGGRFSNILFEIYLVK